MKKLLVIGASILQLPAIIRGKELGYYVAVVDFNPEAIGIPYADEYFEVSTIDEEAVAEVAKEFHADGVMTLATDMPMRSIARVSEVCGLQGISMDTAIKSTDKGEMIKVFEAKGIAHPWYYIVLDKQNFDNVKEEITYPCIMKPLDNAGSRGVILAHDCQELEKEYSYVVGESRQGGIIIEEYMIGTEVSVEAMVLGGVVHILQVTDKITTGAPHFVELGHTQPSRLDEKSIIEIKDLASRAIEAIGIKNGPAHVEIMVTKEGPKMIELGARMGGDCITSHLVPLSTGIDMVRATIAIACGDKIDIESKIVKGSAIRYFETGKGIIESITGVEEAKAIRGVKEISFVKTIGDSVRDIKSSIDRVGFVVAQGEDADDAEKICEKAMSLINIKLRI